MSGLYLKFSEGIPAPSAEESALIPHNLISYAFQDRFEIIEQTLRAKLLPQTYDELLDNTIRKTFVDIVHLFAEKSGVYDWSPTMKAIETRSVVSGIVRNKHGVQEMATSKPLLDENGEIVMVITNARDKDLVENYIAALEKERTTVHRYKTAVEYLSEVDSGNKELVAESPQMKQIIKTSNFIAKADSTVMLIGETGTGKEVMARYIHRNSLRSKEPFIPVNCAAIPHELLESEFFGYVRGAFSGANPQGKPGLFEIADKGTLFLDEIAELPLAMQSKLLRILESGEVQRLGDTNVYRAIHDKIKCIMGVQYEHSEI